MAYETLESLRAELRTRLGYSSAGPSAGVIQENLNSFLKRGQEILYETHDWVRLRKYEDKSVGVNQYLVDYPATANPERIKAISILDGTVWSPPLPKGIRPQLYTTQANTSRPARWEPYEQIELWPKADKIYTARIFFIKLLERFEQDGDVTSIDGGLVFTIALGNAKAHYRHPDAELYVGERDALLTRLKSKSWGRDVFSPNDYVEEAALPKPVVI